MCGGRTLFIRLRIVRQAVSDSQCSGRLLSQAPLWKGRLLTQRGIVRKIALGRLRIMEHTTKSDLELWRWPVSLIIQNCGVKTTPSDLVEVDWPHRQTQIFGTDYLLWSDLDMRCLRETLQCTVPDRVIRSQLARPTRLLGFSSDVKSCVAVCIIYVLFVLFFLIMCI
jgi:hypothetical protein